MDKRVAARTRAIDQAKKAALRDRPDIYKEYLIADLTAMPDATDRALKDYDFNCMVTVAALGFGKAESVPSLHVWPPSRDSARTR